MVVVGNKTVLYQSGAELFKDERLHNPAARHNVPVIYHTKRMIKTRRSGFGFIDPEAGYFGALHERSKVKQKVWRARGEQQANLSSSPLVIPVKEPR